jgi:outer membrane protein
LDVSFAEVAVSEAELALVRAENDVQAGRARLNAALGMVQTETFELADEPLPPALEPNPEAVVAQAVQQRPDLAALRLSRDAAYRFARAEGDLSRPTVSLVGVAGALPDADPRLRSTSSTAIYMPRATARRSCARRLWTRMSTILRFRFPSRSEWRGWKPTPRFAAWM